MHLWRLFTEFRLYLNFITDPKSAIASSLRNTLNDILIIDNLDYYSAVIPDVENQAVSHPVSYGDVVKTARKKVVAEYTEKIYAEVFGNSGEEE